jgi:maltose acetyltransferase-like protein
MSERDKMLKGRLYDGFDPSLLQERQCARVLLAELNRLTYNNACKTVISRLFGKVGSVF